MSLYSGIRHHSSLIPFDMLKLNSSIKDMFLGLNVMWKLSGYAASEVRYLSASPIYVLGDYVTLNIQNPFLELSYQAHYREYVFLLHIENGEIQYPSRFVWERWREDSEQNHDCCVVLNCKEDIEDAISKMIRLVEEHERGIFK